MKANRTGKNNPPPKIEDLQDGTFYYNFNIVHSRVKIEGGRKDDNWDYDQVRLEHPVDVEKIQQEVDAQGYEHTVELEE